MAYGPIAPMHAELEKLQLNLKLQGVEKTQAELKESMTADAIEAVVHKVQRPKRASVNDVPYGELLAFTGKSRDDIMSVIEDLLYDTPMSELKEKHGGLYEAVSKLV